jgi:hypothetical protein
MDFHHGSRFTWMIMRNVNETYVKFVKITCSMRNMCGNICEVCVNVTNFLKMLKNLKY